MRRRMARRSIDRNRRKLLGILAAGAVVEATYTFRNDLFTNPTVENSQEKKYIVEIRNVSPINDVKYLANVDSALDKSDVKKREYFIRAWVDNSEVNNVRYHSYFFQHVKKNIVGKYNIGQYGIWNSSGYDRAWTDSYQIDMNIDKKTIKEEFGVSPTRFIFDSTKISSQAMRAARNLYDIVIDGDKIYNRDSSRFRTVDAIDYDDIDIDALPVSQSESYKSPAVVRMDVSKQQNTDKLTQLIKKLESDGYEQADYNDAMFKQTDGVIERFYNIFINTLTR